MQNYRWILGVALVAGWMVGCGDDNDDLEVGSDALTAFERVDTDTDGLISGDEFNAGLGDGFVFVDFDTNVDTFVARDEFNIAVFNRFDSDRNLFIDEKEFDGGRDDFFGDDELFEDDFDGFDDDFDRRLGFLEFEPAVANYVDSFDEDFDDRLDTDEFGRGMFGILDRNDDDFLDDEEFFE